jgi:hypothetical protein
MSFATTKPSAIDYVVIVVLASILAMSAALLWKAMRI